MWMLLQNMDVISNSPAELPPPSSLYLEYSTHVILDKWVLHDAPAVSRDSFTCLKSLKFLLASLLIPVLTF